MADAQQARDWLEAERAVLLDAVRLAVDNGFPTHAWQLAWGLNTFLAVRGHWHQEAAVWSSALDAARGLGELPAQAFAHRRLANAEAWLAHYDAADGHFRADFDLCARAGNRIGQAHAQHGLAFLRERQGRPKQALHHGQKALTLFRMPATNGERPARSTPSAGTTPYSMTTRRPSTIASRPSPCASTSAAGRARPQPRTEAFEILSDLGHPDADRVKTKLDGSRRG